VPEPIEKSCTKKLPEAVGYSKDHELFIKKIKFNGTCKKEEHSSDCELECVKNYLHDWICWSTKNLAEMSSCYFDESQSCDSDQDEKVNTVDIQVFTNYLLYLLHVSKNLEMLVIILKVFKRLAYKSGSFEWISICDNTLATVQSDFFIKYDLTLELN
jgi:hypothetical protein